MEKLIQSTKTRPGADCGSDHELLTTKFRLKLKKVGKTTRWRLHNLAAHRTDTSTRLLGLQGQHLCPTHLHPACSMTAQHRRDTEQRMKECAKGQIRKKQVSVEELPKFRTPLGGMPSSHLLECCGAFSKGPGPDDL